MTKIDQVTDELPSMGEEEIKGTEVDVKGTETSQTDVDDLIAELEKAGVTNTEQLHNKLAVTKEYGNVVNLLGDLKAENRQLRETLESAKQRKGRDEDLGFEDTNHNADLGDLINQVMDKREAKQFQRQQEYNKVVLATWNKIQNDEDYGLVKDVWELKMKDPNFVFKIQQGQVNPTDEYHNTVREYYKGIAKRSVETIKTLQGGGKIKPPHVESGSARVPGVDTKEDKTAQQEKLERFTDKVDKGGKLTAEEEMEALMANLTK